jgi:hypothetical protein
MLVNLTPHDVNIFLDDSVYTIKPSLPPARRTESFSPWGDIDQWNGESYLKIPFGHLSYNEVRDLPKPVGGVWYIVSVLVAQANPKRIDLVIPYDLVRKDGRVIGCRKLARLTPE